MKTWKTGWVASLLLPVLFSLAVAAQSQVELDRQACDEHKKADAELNRVYQQVLAEYKTDAIFIAKLRGAQRAWITYRDAQLAALYPAPVPQRAYGSVFRMCYCQAKTELTLERTEVLRRWIMGLEAGDVCSGSIKIRDYTGKLQNSARRVAGKRRTQN